MNVHRKALSDGARRLFIAHVPPVLSRYIDQSLTLDVTPTGSFSIQDCCRSTSRPSSKSEPVASDKHPRSYSNIPTDSFSNWSALADASAAPAFIISAVALVLSMMFGLCHVSVSFAACHIASAAISAHALSYEFCPECEGGSVWIWDVTIPPAPSSPSEDLPGVSWTQVRLDGDSYCCRVQPLTDQ